jgi:hypothetical protein
VNIIAETIACSDFGISGETRSIQETSEFGTLLYLTNRIVGGRQRCPYPNWGRLGIGLQLVHFPFASVPADMNIRMTLSRSLGMDRRRPLRREIPNRSATLRMVSSGRFMRFAISSGDRAFAASSSKRHKTN